MKFREHRGSLAASMRTIVELNTKEEFTAHIRKVVKPFVGDGKFTLRFKPYGYDERIGWDTVLIVLEGHCPIGMADGPPPWFKARPEFIYGESE